MLTCVLAIPNHRSRTAAVVLAGFCAFLTIYAPQPLLPMLAAAFAIPAAAISLVMTASTMAVAIAAPFTGMAADRLGRKRVIVASAFLLAAPTLLASTSAGLPQLVFWRFWQGVFTPGIFAVTIAYINDEWDAGAGAAMSAYVTGTVAGGFSGRMIGALIAARFGWRASFTVLALLAALGAIALWVWLPADRHFARKSSKMSMIRHFRNPRLVATYATGFCVLFTLVACFTYVNFYLAAPPFLFGTAALGLLFLVYPAGASIVPFAGRLIDRMGHRFVLTAAFSGGIAGAALTLVASVPVVMLGLTLCCGGVFIAQSAASSYIGTVADEARAAAVGLYAAFYYVGGSLGAWLPGKFWDRGGWPACVALIVLAQIFAIALTAVFWRPARARR